MDCDPRCDFAGSYELSGLPAVRALERGVLGCDYGGTSWTTLGQLPHIRSSLGLSPGIRLLEAGSGSGWPGLHLSRISGCRVTLLDLPRNALRQAGERAGREHIGDRVELVNASATALPFAASSFDGVSHSDVLCCLPGKRDMLRECRRVLRESGRMHFSVIRPAHGLEDAALQHALEVGPPFVEVGGTYRELLRDTGWTLVERLDVTAEFAQALERFVAGLESESAVFKDAFGAEAYKEAVAHRREQIRAVHAGLLQRYVFVAAAS